MKGVEERLVGALVVGGGGGVAQKVVEVHQETLVPTYKGVQVYWDDLGCPDVSAIMSFYLLSVLH